MRSGPVARLLLTRMRLPLAAVAAVLVGATAGYVVLEGAPLFDAFYFTATTLTTVGYGEVIELDRSGRILTLGVIATGFTATFSALAILTEVVASGELAAAVRDRRQQRLRRAASRHVVIVGFGRVGEAVTRSLREQGVRCVVVDRDAGRQADIATTGAAALVGDATDEQVLEEAGAARALALVAATDSDATNLVVAMTAKTVRPELRVLARVTSPRWAERLRQAGAELALSPYQTVGSSLAAAALDPLVVGLQDVAALGLRTEELALPAGSPAVGLELAELDRRHPSVAVAALRRAGTGWAKAVGALAEGDVLVATGPPEALADLTLEIEAPT